MKIIVIHGPNLNLLGSRQTQFYGNDTLESLNTSIADYAIKNNAIVTCVQYNSEGDLVDVIQKSGGHDFIIINPAAYTHTSIAMRDALLAINVPFIEVHLSNIFARENFRHTSYFSDIAVGVVSGLGVNGYLFAMNYAINTLLERKKINGHQEN